MYRPRLVLLGLSLLATGCSQSHATLEDAIDHGNVKAVATMLTEPTTPIPEADLTGAVVQCLLRGDRRMLRVLLLHIEDLDASIPRPGRTSARLLDLAIYPGNCKLEFDDEQQVEDYIASIRLLVASGATVGTALVKACRKTSPRQDELARRATLQAIRLLCPRADLELQSGNRTGLQLAALRGDITLAKILIAHGANVRTVATGEPPLQLAKTTGHSEMVRLLKQHGATDD